jgi:hypothetical protein
VLRDDPTIGRVVTNYDGRDPALVSADRESTFVAASPRSGEEYAS